LEISSTASQIYSSETYLRWDGFVSISLHPKYFWKISYIWLGSVDFTASKKRIFGIFDNHVFNTVKILAAQKQVFGIV